MRGVPLAMKLLLSLWQIRRQPTQYPMLIAEMKKKTAWMKTTPVRDV